MIIKCKAYFPKVKAFLVKVNVTAACKSKVWEYNVLYSA